MDAPLVIAVSRSDVLFDPTGKVEVSFVANNVRAEAVSVSPRLVPIDSTAQWGIVVGEPERVIAPGAKETYTVQIAVPPADWSAKRSYRYALRLELVDADGTLCGSSKPITARAAGQRPINTLGRVIISVIVVLGILGEIWAQVAARDAGLIAASGRKLADYGAEIDLDLDEPDGVADLRLEDPQTTRPGSTAPFRVPTRSIIPTPPGVTRPPTVSLYDFVPPVVVVTALNSAQIGPISTSLGLRTCRGQLRAGKDSTVAHGGQTLCLLTSRGKIVEFGLKEVDPATDVIIYTIYRQWLYTR